jgi:hypothetical protein
MSDFRQGVCKDCEAQFKIPASFTHDRAKCNQCGGTVEIVPAKASATPKAAPKAKPIPAKPAPSKAAAPAEKQMTMKEKIMARKKAESEAKPASSPVAAAKPATTKKPAAKPAPRARRGKAGSAQGDEPKADGRRPGGRKAPGSKGGSRKRGGSKRRGDEVEETGTRGRAQKEKKSPVAGLIAIAVLVIGGGAGWYFTVGPGGAEDSVKKEEVAKIELTDKELSAQEDAADALAAKQDLEDKAAAEAEALKAEEDAAAALEAAKPKEPKAAKVYEPLEVLYDEFPIYGKAVGTSDEEWTEIVELVTTFADMDAGARGPRAGRQLEEMGYKALPAILNEVRTFDLGSSNGHIAGDMFQRKIMNLLNGKNAGWESERDPNTGDPVPRAHMVNRMAIRLYLKTWSMVAEDPTLWIGTAKLTEEKYEEQLIAYAAALEADGITEGEYIEFATEALAGGSNSSSDEDDEDDLTDF